MKKLLAILLAWILILPGLAKADGSVLPPVPASGNVTLPLDEYNHLLELASKPARKTDAPPVPYSMKRADLKFRVTDESVQGTIQLQGEILHKGATKVPLTTGMAILDARQEGKSLPLALETNAHRRSEWPLGIFSDSRRRSPVEHRSGSRFVQHSRAIGGQRTFALVVPGDHTNVRVSPGLITTRSSENGQASIEATLVPGVQANIWWTTREAAAPVVANEIPFFPTSKHSSPSAKLKFESPALADISVVQGEPAQFEIEIPSGYEVTGTTGASIESSEVDPGSGFEGGRPRATFASIPDRHGEIHLGHQMDAPFLSFKNAQRRPAKCLSMAPEPSNSPLRKRAASSAWISRKPIRICARSRVSRCKLHFAITSSQTKAEPRAGMDAFSGQQRTFCVAERAVVTTLVTMKAAR